MVIRDSSVSEFNQNVTLLMESAGPAMSIELRNSEFVVSHSYRTICDFFHTKALAIF